MVTEAPVIAVLHPTRADWIASALPMTGHRWPRSCSLEIVPPHWEAWGRVEVESARKVDGVAFFRKGHMALDWRRTVSIVIDLSMDSPYTILQTCKSRVQKSGTGLQVERRKI